MKVSKYVQDMMSRARFDRNHSSPKSNPGYSICIRKATPYTSVNTLWVECERLVTWAKRNSADAEILECPEKTHYFSQAALVTITNPVMKELEKCINEENRLPSPPYKVGLLAAVLKNNDGLALRRPVIF